MLVSVTVTPVMCFYLLPKLKGLGHGDTKVQAFVKSRYARALQKVLEVPRRWLGAAAVAVMLAAVAVPFFSTTFLPPFNEGVALVGLRLNPGTTLA